MRIISIVLGFLCLNVYGADQGYRYVDGQCQNEEGEVGYNSLFFGQCGDWRRASLGGIDLTGYDLSGSNFDSANLSRVNFSEATLTGVDFRNALIGQADFSAATIENSSFDRSELTGAVFFEVKIKDTSFRNAKVKASEFFGSMIISTDFSNSSFEKSIFEEVSITRGVFQRVSVTESQIKNTKLSNSSLKEAQLKKTEVTQSEFASSDFKDSLIEESKFQNVNLFGTGFQNSTFYLSSLLGVVSKNSDFSEVEFRWNHLDFESVTLNKFDGARFSGGSIAAKEWLGNSLEKVKSLSNLKVSLEGDALKAWKEVEVRPFKIAFVDVCKTERFKTNEDCAGALKWFERIMVENQLFGQAILVGSDEENRKNLEGVTHLYIPYYALYSIDGEMNVKFAKLLEKLVRENGLKVYLHHFMLELFSTSYLGVDGALKAVGSRSGLFRLGRGGREIQHYLKGPYGEEYHKVLGDEPKAIDRIEVAHVGINSNREGIKTIYYISKNQPDFPLIAEIPHGKGSIFYNGIGVYRANPRLPELTKLEDLVAYWSLKDLKYE